MIGVLYEVGGWDVEYRGGRKKVNSQVEEVG